MALGIYLTVWNDALSEARQKLAIVLEQAEDTGKVLIRRKDGRTFALVPENIASSPFVTDDLKLYLYWTFENAVFSS